MSASAVRWPWPTREARGKQCPRCGAWCLFGLDADVAAHPLVVDAEPVTYLEAVIGVITGRAVAVLAGGRRPEGAAHPHGGRLEGLDDLHLTGGPPRRYPLHLEHRCTPTTSTSTSTSTTTERTAPR